MVDQVDDVGGVSGGVVVGIDVGFLGWCEVIMVGSEDAIGDLSGADAEFVGADVDVGAIAAGERAGVERAGIADYVGCEGSGSTCVDAWGVWS